MSMQDIDNFLMGGKRNSAKFPTVGTTVKGVVISKALEQQKDMDGKAKFYDDGNPMNQMVIGLQTEERDAELTDDDGIRYVFAKGNMLVAIRDAVKKAGKQSLDLGDELAVKYTGDGVAKTRGFSAPKLYAAKVVQGTPPPPAVDFDDDEAPF
jgi:hypothetical protein